MPRNIAPGRVRRHGRRPFPLAASGNPEGPAPAPADARLPGSRQPRFGLAGVPAWGLALM